MQDGGQLICFSQNIDQNDFAANILYLLNYLFVKFVLQCVLRRTMNAFKSKFLTLKLK